GEFFHGLAQALSEATAGIPNGVGQIVEGTGGCRGGEVGTKPATLPLEHVASGACSAAKEELTTTHEVDGHFQGRGCQGADVGRSVPDLFLGHADALLRGAIRRHSRSRHPVADDGENLLIGVAVLLRRTCEVRSPTATAGTKTVAKGTVCTELVLAELGYF